MPQNKGKNLTLEFRRIMTKNVKFLTRNKLIKNLRALAGVVQLDGASTHEKKGRGFSSWPGHMPELQLGCSWSTHTGGN